MLGRSLRDRNCSAGAEVAQTRRAPRPFPAAVFPGASGSRGTDRIVVTAADLIRWRSDVESKWEIESAAHKI